MKHADEICEIIKAEAISLGFCAVGFARPEPVAAEAADAFRRYIDAGGHAQMSYMAGHEDMRLNPALLMPEARTIISLAMAYDPKPTHGKAGELRAPYSGAEDGAGPDAGNAVVKRELRAPCPIAAYALGDDYHEVLRGRLNALAAHIAEATGADFQYRAFTDTAPILERYWAERSGVGRIGRNHQLIVPGVGPAVFLGELFIDIELPPTSPLPAESNGCDACHACERACPMGALRGDVFLAGHCLSYHTIECRDPLAEEARRAMSGKSCGSGASLVMSGQFYGCADSRAMSYDCADSGAMSGQFYGCDRCTAVCPHNRPATVVPELRPRTAILDMTDDDWRRLTIEQYQSLFRHSAVKRAKYDGLIRNIRAFYH